MMNEIKTSPDFGQTSPIAPTDRRTEQPPAPSAKTHTRSRRGLLGASVALALAGGLGYGGWRDYTARREAAAVVEQRLDFVHRRVADFDTPVPRGDPEASSGASPLA